MRPVGTLLFHADRWTVGRTDRRDEANNPFTQLCKYAPKKIDHLKFVSGKQSHVLRSTQDT